MSRIFSIRTSFSLTDQLMACQKGDEKAMRWVFQQFAPKMLGVCRRYLFRIDLAEEAVSSGFARAFNNLHSLREYTKFEGWLKAIMVRECIDTVRREQRYLFSDDPLELPEQTFSASIENQMAAEELLRLIDQLPTGYRTVFNLFAIEGFGHSEIADMLGISENTSKTQFKKAKSAIQQRLPETLQKHKSYGSY